MAEVFTLKLSNGLKYPYRVNLSKRAKYIRIKLSRQGDLSVTLPSFTNINLAHEFIRSKKIWIEKNLLKVSVSETEVLPETLHLRLLNEYWKVLYTDISKDLLSIESNATNLTLIEKTGNILELKGNTKQINDSLLVPKILNQWCRMKAKVIFNTMLQELAELHGFHFKRLSIRAQKTRWGSCSSEKNINLNCKLLFMPEEVVKYVMIHELCHTIEMNHSSRFWSLVADCDPAYQNHKKLLKKLSKEI